MGLFDDVISRAGSGAAGDYFTAGAHEVKVGEVQKAVKNYKSNPKASVLTVTVFGFDKAQGGKECTAETTLQFHTEGAAKFAVGVVSGLVVHNAPADKKDEVREKLVKLFADVKDLEQARNLCFDILNEKLINKEAFILVEPTGAYNTSKYANLFAYLPKPKVVDDADSIIANSTVLAEDEIKEIPGFKEGAL